MKQPLIDSWIKTSCGQAKYQELSAKAGPINKLRLYWFVFFAALRDWHLNNVDQIEESDS